MPCKSFSRKIDNQTSLLLFAPALATAIGLRGQLFGAGVLTGPNLPASIALDVGVGER
jgi:hypothetical protein